MSKRWRTLIIDDEDLARNRLARLLKPFEELEIIGEAVDGEEGLLLIQKLSPDLVFLDIQMPVLDGFEMLAKLKTQPRIIFTTAYDQYAIKAFEQNSIDYLLKPIQTPRLEKTIEKLRQVSADTQTLPVVELLKQMQPAPQLKTLTVKTGDRILLIKVIDIVFIEAEDKYVFIHTSDGKKHLTEYVLSELEKKLPEPFLRIHRSTILNTEQIKEIRKSFNSSFAFVMQGPGKHMITSSRTYNEALKQKLGL